MPLSGGDLILIYSRVPNKLVFAVVTSGSPSRSRLWLLSLVRLRQLIPLPIAERFIHKYIHEYR